MVAVVVTVAGTTVTEATVVAVTTVDYLGA